MFVRHYQKVSSGLSKWTGETPILLWLAWSAECTLDAYATVLRRRSIRVLEATRL